MKGLSGMRNKMKIQCLITTLLAILLILSLQLYGCSSGKEEPTKRPTAARVANEVKKVVEPEQEQEQAKEIEKKEEFFPGYTAKDMRDPFVSFLKEEVAAVNRRKALTPLEKFDLGELKLVGVLSKGNETVALVEDNEGKGYTVKRGTRIGRNGGVVGKITVKEVVIIEEFFDISGRKIRKEKKLALPIPGGE